MTETPPPRLPRFKKRKPQPKTPQPQRLGDDQEVVPDVSLTHQKLVGRVLIVWSKLEAGMQDAIWHFLDLDVEDGRIITARNDAEDNILMLRSLAKRHLPPQRYADFSLVLDTIAKRQEDRNTIAHGTWGTLRPDHVPIATMIRRKADIGEVWAETFPRNRMLAILDDLIGCLEALVALVAELASTPDRSAPAD